MNASPLLLQSIGPSAEEVIATKRNASDRASLGGAVVRVGFIGLGAMGREMAANLAKAGHELTVYDIQPAALAAMSGVRAARDVASCVRDADVVITMLPDTPHVESVLLGADGVLENPPRGKLVIEMSTIASSATRAMAQKLAGAGVDMLDAPVSGGALGAKEARLSIMVGGEAAAFARALPILKALGTTIVHVGPIGAGQTVKACNQLVVATNIQAVCEALALGRAAGIDLNARSERGVSYRSHAQGPSASR